MKKRKIKLSRLLILLFIFILIIAFFIFLIKALFNDNEEYVFNVDDLNINEIDYSEMKEFDFDLYSNKYLLIRLNDFKVLYGKDVDSRFYPASLTKIMTMDSVVNIFKNLNDTSYITDDDYNELINANASLAYLKVNKEYTLNDLLYALVLPSGGDAAKALENYFEKNNLDLIEEMNILANDLKMYNSNFTNSAGLHDDNLYTSLNDYCRLVIDVLKNKESKDVVKTFAYYLDDGTVFYSTLRNLKRNDEIITYGGKTGFTDEAGENLMVLFSFNKRSYMLILANAPGNPYLNEPYHFMDANKIFKFLIERGL